MQKKLKRTVDSLLDEISPLEQAKTDAKMVLAARIADAMEARKWKRKDLLAAVGKMNPSVITKWLSGTHNFTVETLVELEDALGVSLLNLDVKRQETIITYHFFVSNEVELCSEPDDFDKINILEGNDRIHLKKGFTGRYNNLIVRA